MRSSSVLREVCIPGQTQSCYCFDFVALETSVHTAIAVKILNKSFCNYTLRQLGWLLSFSMFKKIIADPCKGTCTNSELNTICVRSKTLTCFVSWYWSFSSWDNLLRNSWDSCWDSSVLFIFGALNTGSGFSCSAAGALRPVIDQTFSMYLILLFRRLQTGMDRELFLKSGIEEKKKWEGKRWLRWTFWKKLHVDSFFVDAYTQISSKNRRSLSLLLSSFYCFVSLLFNFFL